jgi:hypothetical protein
MAGFVMFSQCKLQQAQSRAAAKAEHEDQLSNGDAPGVVCVLSRTMFITNMHFARPSFMQVPPFMHI